MKRLLLIAYLIVTTACGAWAFPGSPISGGGGSGTTNASDLSSGTLPPARIGDNSILNAKIASDAAIDVTKTTIGTWAGSANITTLGTVGTGTWNATVISRAKGGFGIDLSAWGTCFNWFNGGTPTCDNAGTMRSNLGLGSSDSVTFGTVTAANFVSMAADNTRGVTVPNTADPTGVNLVVGKLWFNITSNIPKVRNGDNSATLMIPTYSSGTPDNTSVPYGHGKYVTPKKVLSFSVPQPVAADNIVFGPFPNVTVIDNAFLSIYDNTSVRTGAATDNVTFNWLACAADNTANASCTKLWTSDQTATGAASVSTSTFTNATIPANYYLRFAITTINGIGGKMTPTLWYHEQMP